MSFGDQNDRGGFGGGGGGGGGAGGAGGRRPFFRRRKTCPFSGDNAPKIDYMDAKLLSRAVIGEPGKNLVAGLVIPLRYVLVLLFLGKVGWLTHVRLAILDRRSWHPGSGEGEVVGPEVRALQ